MSDFRIDQITNQAGTAGPQIAGITTFSGSSGLVMPSGPTEYRGGRGRGIFGGGTTPTLLNTIEYITIATTGDATDFGDLTTARRLAGACASSTRGLFGGAYNPYSDSIEYITISSTGNASTFGNLTQSRGILSSCSNSIRGLFAGGYINTPAATRFNIVDYVTIASTGNAQDFGDLFTGRYALSACASPTRGVFSGGRIPSATNTLDYITISSTGNAQDFGDLTQARSGLAALSNGHGGL